MRSITLLAQYQQRNTFSVHSKERFPLLLTFSQVLFVQASNNNENSNVEGEIVIQQESSYNTLASPLLFLPRPPTEFQLRSPLREKLFCVRLFDFLLFIFNEC